MVILLSRCVITHEIIFVFPSCSCLCDLCNKRRLNPNDIDSMVFIHFYITNYFRLENYDSQWYFVGKFINIIDGWKSLLSLCHKPNKGITDMETKQKWGKIHLWHRMKQLSNISSSVSRLAMGIEPWTHILAVQHATTRLTTPSPAESEHHCATSY